MCRYWGWRTFRSKGRNKRITLSRHARRSYRLYPSRRLQRSAIANICSVRPALVIPELFTRIFTMRACFPIGTLRMSVVCRCIKNAPWLAFTCLLVPCAHTHTHTHAHTHACIHARSRAHTHVCTHTRIHARTHVRRAHYSTLLYPSRPRKLSRLDWLFCVSINLPIYCSIGRLDWLIDRSINRLFYRSLVPLIG